VHAENGPQGMIEFGNCAVDAQIFHGFQFSKEPGPFPAGLHVSAVLVQAF
jgi:hypothetical protein